jgi:hypothetical protein
MKFLKTQNTSRYAIADNAFRVNPYGRYIMDGTGALRLPKGTTAERPQLAGVSTPEGANGYIRYNTTIDAVTGAQIGLEAYINGVWEVVRAPGIATITKQTLGPGDYVDDVFGPLIIVPAASDNILVFVENVFQISTANFLLEQNTTAGAGAEIAATSMTNGTDYVIVTVGGTDYVAVGSPDNNIGTVFTATGPAASGTGTVREAGWYLRFQEPVPLDKYVTVYFGFAN